MFIHPTNLGVGFAQTTHVKDRSFNHPMGLYEIHSSARRGFEKSFKANVTKKYDEWMAVEAHFFTAAGNMQAPPRREIVKVDPCDVGWLEQNNDYQFIQELCVNRCCGWIRGRTHHDCFKENQPCRAGLERLKVVQQAMSRSRDKDPFDGITERDAKDAAPDSLIIDASNTEVIDVEKINS